MLTHFFVKNYTCFDDLRFSLKGDNYPFHRELLKHKIVNKALVLGGNDSGKSALGHALFDITHHLAALPGPTQHVWCHNSGTSSEENSITFQYNFSFDGTPLAYYYVKNERGELLNEILCTHDKRLLEYNREEQGFRFISGELMGGFDFCQAEDIKTSVVRYVYLNNPRGCHPLLQQLMHFCQNMLWLSGQSAEDNHCGLTNDCWTLDRMVCEYGDIREFNDLLSSFNVHVDLGIEEEDGRPIIYSYFKGTDRKVPLQSAVSSGTLALWRLYAWMKFAQKDLSLLFIDDFDACYQADMASRVVEYLNSKKDFQSILTTHTTGLMQNKFTRPDCCFLMSKGSIKSLKNSTDQKLDKNHDLEKLYLSGAFG